MSWTDEWRPRRALSCVGQILLDDARTCLRRVELFAANGIDLPDWERVTHDRHYRAAIKALKEAKE